MRRSGGAGKMAVPVNFRIQLTMTTQMINKALAGVALAFLLAACGSTSVVKQPVAAMPATSSYSVGTLTNATPKDGDQPPETFMSTLQGHVRSELGKEGRLAAAGAAASAQVDVKVTSYRMRSAFSRLMWGILAGKDGVDSEVTIKDAMTGEVLGSSTVTSYNATTIVGEDGVARMHGQEIAKFVLNKGGTVK